MPGGVQKDCSLLPSVTVLVRPAGNARAQLPAKSSASASTASAG